MSHEGDVRVDLSVQGKKLYTYEVFNAVGALDESFGKGGAEDNDYCVRTYMAGYCAKYALKSFVLHFQGRSTWQLATSAQEQKALQKEDQERFTLFEKKWGRKILDWFIFQDKGVMQEIEEREHEAVKELWGKVIQELHPK